MIADFLAFTVVMLLCLVAGVYAISKFRPVKGY